MRTKRELQQQLRNCIGSDEISLVRDVEVSSLSLEQIRELLAKRNVGTEGTREHLENVLIGTLGGDKVVIDEMVKIDSLNFIQLEDALNCVSSRPDVEVESIGVEDAPVLTEKQVPALEGPKKTIRQAQQELAENCGIGDKIIWDLLASNNAEIMKNKIKQLIPDQKEGQKAIENIRNVLFNNLWAQRKYTNGTSVSYIFYVMVTKDSNFNTAPDSEEFSCHPVFRCKKCDESYDSSDCCMIYVDETGRVYQNWDSFVNENVLPAGTMVAPRNGIYNFNKHHEVIFDVYVTPSNKTGAKIMDVAQTGTAVLGIGAACVPIVALATPVVLPFVATAGLVGLGVGAFSSVASALHLVDRSSHEQSISVGDREARSSYIGLLGGVVGMAAAGTTRLMTSMASAGEATAGIEILVNGINISSIVLSGSGVANGVLDLLLKYSDGDKISTLDVLQLSASLVLFTHSVYNFQLASQIANNARSDSIRAYRETLSNRQRKMFDKMAKETMRISGSAQGKIDIIRGVNEIPDRQYLNDLFKINKQMNQRNVRPAFGKSGNGIVLNNELPVDSSALRQSVQHSKGPNILDQVSKPIPTTYNSDNYTNETPKMARLLYSNGIIEQNYDHLLQDPFKDEQNRNPSTVISILRNLALQLPNGIFIALKQYGNEFLNNIADGYKFEDIILSMAENFSEKTLNLLMILAKDFIGSYLVEIERTIRIFIPTESVLYRIVLYILDNYNDLGFEYLSQKVNDIKLALKNYYLSLNPTNEARLMEDCPKCKGKFFICKL